MLSIVGLLSNHALLLETVMEGTSQLLFLSLLLNTVMECASKLLLLFQELLRR